MIRHVFMTIIACLLMSCTATLSDKSEAALMQAGANNEELLKVLTHYKNGDDTLKYKAAVYLIENMPYHASIVNESNYIVEEAKENFILDGFIQEDTLQKLIAEHARSMTVPDIKVVKAEYLIDNIDRAFVAWRSRPWGKHYTFAEFCEYILPYRATSEPLTDWRRVFEERYGYILDSLYTGDDVVEATNAVCKVLKDEGYIHTMTFNPFGPASPLFVADHRIGDCSDECNFTILVMRALGIPVQYDFYPFSPETFSSHGWCVVLDTTKHNVPFFLFRLFCGTRQNGNRSAPQVQGV